MRGILAVFLALAPALLSPSVSYAGPRPYRIRPFHINGTLGGVAGRLIVGLSGEAKAYTEWDLPQGWRNPGPAAISLSDPGASPDWLGYNPKTGQVVLADTEQGDIDCRWEVVQQPDGPGLYLRASFGKYRGWYMTVAEEVEEAKDCKGKPYTFHRVLLTEKPSKRSEWAISEIGK